LMNALQLAPSVWLDREKAKEALNRVSQ